MAGFYSARGSIMPPLPWPTFAPPLSRDGDQFEGYLDGADSGTAQEAVEEPISATRELIAATILAGDLVDGQVLEITDESGSVGVIVPFRSALKLE